MIRILNNHGPTDWHGYNWARYTETTVYDNSMEYLKLKMDMMGMFVTKINKITKVESPALYGQFLLKQAEYKSRSRSFTIRELYHDTAASNIPSILTGNLDWRRVSRHKFGCGVSFSPSSTYANKQSSRSNGTTRAMIVADVLVGVTHPGNECTSLPPFNSDTTVGNGDSVYVKFYDHEFYPKYIIYYESAPRVYRPRYRRNVFW